jgi:hypothetical protein
MSGQQTSTVGSSQSAVPSASPPPASQGSGAPTPPEPRWPWWRFAIIAVLMALVVLAAVAFLARTPGPAAAPRLPGFDIASLTGLILVLAGLWIFAAASQRVRTPTLGSAAGAYLERELQARSLREAALFSLALITLGAVLSLGSPALEAVSGPVPTQTPTATEVSDKPKEDGATPTPTPTVSPPGGQESGSPTPVKTP